MASQHTGYLNIIGRRYEDDETLRAAAAQIQDTLNSPGWQVIATVLEEVHGSYYKNLILGHASMRGAVPTQAEYARATGFLSGVEQPQVAAEAFAIAIQAMNERNTSD